MIQNWNRRKSLQELIGIDSFTRYGLAANKGELLFFQVAPANLSVLSRENVERCIRNLTQLLSAVPDLEVLCADACECFDDNRAFLLQRLEEETNPTVRDLLRADAAHLEEMQSELSNARQFILIKRCAGLTQEQVFQLANRMTKVISDQGFDVRRMDKTEIKRFLGIYFGATVTGELLPDVDGAQYISEEDSACLHESEKP